MRSGLLDEEIHVVEAMQVTWKLGYSEMETEP
jgi:hypothetical protein